MLAHRPCPVFVFDAPGVLSAAAGSNILYCLHTPRGMSRVLVVLVAVLACVQQALAHRGGCVPVATPRNVCMLELAGGLLGENVTLHHVLAQVASTQTAQESPTQQTEHVLGRMSLGSATATVPLDTSGVAKMSSA